MATQRCVDLYGNWLEVDEGLIEATKRVYGVVKRCMPGGDQVLTITIKSTGKFYLPGGGIEPGESEEAALKRELMEETGLKVRVNRQIPVIGHVYFHHNTYRVTWAAKIEFYSCTALTELNRHHVIDDLEAADPQWVSLRELHAERFQKGIGEYIMEAINYKG